MTTTARPSSASRLMNWWISALAPTSPPRVGRAMPVEFVGERAANHRANDLVAVESAGDVVRDHLAVAQNGDAIRAFERLFERVRNEDDRHAALLQALHQREKVQLLLGRQRSCR